MGIQGFQLQLTNATNSTLTIGATPSGAFTQANVPPTSIANGETSGLIYFEVSGSAFLQVNFAVQGQLASNGGFVKLAFDSASTNLLNGTAFMYQYDYALVQPGGLTTAYIYPNTLLYPVNQSWEWPFLCVTFIPVVAPSLAPGEFLPPNVAFKEPVP